MEMAGLFISIIALLCTLFTYFKHDRKIKKQDVLINEYLIEKIEKEKTEEKKAIIEVTVIKHEESKRQIKIYNRGKSVAKNVIVTFSDIGKFREKVNPCPIDIKPKNSIIISLLIFISTPDKIVINYKWSDDFCDKNIEKQTIQLV